MELPRFDFSNLKFGTLYENPNYSVCIELHFFHIEKKSVGFSVNVEIKQGYSDSHYSGFCARERS